ncbi:hypothetical protein A0K93_08160 [Corynebacterium sp. BCW_4722]|nr:hypothetical protein A0K93_08160 [Corynebacterium sp. BCW_4722]
MHPSRRIVAVATTAALLPTIFAAAPTAQAVADCEAVPNGYYQIGPLIASSSYNTNQRNFCSQVQFGSWWKGINGSPDVVGLLNVPLARNLFFIVSVEAHVAQWLGIFSDPKGTYDNSRVR